MKIARAWEDIIVELGYPHLDEHLNESPARVERFMREWHTLGSPPPKITTFPTESDDVVVIGDIRFYSMCAHHGLPFFGEASVGYLPGKKIAGLSKFARVVDHFARRFQVQERLTRQIAAYLTHELEPLGLGVVVRAEHLCMSMRGIERPGHRTTTSAMLGVFRDKPEARAELLELMRAGDG